VYPDKGPLCGIYTALRHARTEYCFILACDMPFPSMRLIEAMVKKLDGQKALVPREGNRLQPFFALYSQEIKGCLYSILLGENLRVCNVAVQIGAEYMDLSVRSTPTRYRSSISTTPRTRLFFATSRA
jgi:molybdopterin-guanine dinucleotide biosynthesis protein A